MSGSLKDGRAICRRRDNYLRGTVFLIGFLLGEMVLLVLGHDWEYGVMRFFIGLMSGGVLFLVSEFGIGIGRIEFIITCGVSGEFKLRHLILHFIENHREYFPTQRARLALSLVLADTSLDTVEMKMSFPFYLKLLSAAAITTQHEWFATYRMPLDKWGEITAHSVEYFRVLSRARLKKTRIIIRPEEEINSITYESEIVDHTLDTGAALCCIPNERLKGVEDYAMFDDELVITATPDSQNNSASILGLTRDLYDKATDLDRTYTVRLFRGPDNIGEFLTDKNRLIGITKKNGAKKFTRSGRTKHKKEAGGQNLAAQQATASERTAQARL